MIRSVLIAGLLFSATIGVAQNTCSFSLSGTVSDEHDGQVLVNASIFLLQQGKGVYTDAEGFYKLEGLCAGSDTLRITHIGCETVFLPIEFSGSAFAKTRDVSLEHHAELLESAVVHEHRNSASGTDAGASLNEAQLSQSAGQEISSILERLPGVTTLSTGANIGRPLVDGLGGSRLQVIRDGVPLASQDWGDEHALEIDAWGAQSVQLARAGGIVSAGSSTTGASLVIDDSAMPRSKALKGQLLALGASNNDLFGGGLKLEQRLSPSFGIRVKGNYSFSGDSRAPDYVLSNTGERRGGGGIQAFYEKKGLEVVTRYSLFQQEAGILRAAHIGNLTDLNRALESDKPLIVRPYTRDIEAPRQTVAHHWFNTKLKYELDNQGSLVMHYSYQFNQRKEYDIRRLGRSAIPSIDLELSTIHSRISYFTPLRNKWKGEWGLQAYSAKNRNAPNTGVRPFIPYYNSSSLAIYGKELWVKDQTSVELSGRFEGKFTDAIWWSRPGEGGSQRKTWERLEMIGNLSVGFSRYLTEEQTLKIKLAYSSRTPNPAERFADGVHHSLAVIEVGDTSMHEEHGLKLLTGWSYEADTDWSIHAGAWVQAFDGFIYSQPRERPALTIRGAFPVLEYKQADALLAGADIDMHYTWDKIRFDLSGQALYGNLRNSGSPLPDIAPWQSTFGISYSETFTGRMKDISFGASWMQVGRQNRIPANLPKDPPSAFGLLNAQVQTHIALGNQVLNVQVQGENLLNNSYRLYLDRLRFYADRPGRNIRLRLLYNF